MSNHLEHESSPYLQQHKNNPVDWYPWGAEALEKAKREDKPILLSIGYAACHWCHVMEHESFENKETAALMNELFINIKVDREERPDLDKVYQSAHYLLSQRSGGWPLTVFLTPGDLVPFFSGTYFPPESRYQLPAFTDILLGVAGAYQNNREGIKTQNQQLLGLLQHTQSKESAPVLNAEPISRAIQVFEQHYDHANGGFGGAPKFPQPARLDFLLHTAPQMSFDTLQHMQHGGIYDQLGGGFFRYSVDNQWRIPHFEKMLYDNGQLLYLYSFVDKYIARDTAEWLINTMQSAEGGYYSSIDADSEGHEGKFYVWDKEEIKSILTADEYAVVSKAYGLDLPANFENHWHLYVAAPVSSAEENTLRTAREKLLAVRSRRVPPFIDKKILVAWNALAIKGMLSAGSKWQEQRFIDSAELALQLIHKKLWVNRRLFASYKDQKAYLAAYLDDYAFLLDALITALQINWSSDYLYFAREVADTLIEQFYDKENGAFYFTAHDHETLLYRPKTMADEATPSGNGVAARVLLVLGYLLAETRYLDAAEKTLQAAAPFIREYPSEHTSLLLALKEYLLPSQIIVLRGEQEELPRWQASVSSINNYVFAIPNTANLPAALATKKARDKVCAYVCQGTQCLDVIDDIETLERVKK